MPSIFNFWEHIWDLLFNILLFLAPQGNLLVGNSTVMYCGSSCIFTRSNNYTSFRKQWLNVVLCHLLLMSHIYCWIFHCSLPNKETCQLETALSYNVKTHGSNYSNCTLFRIKRLNIVNVFLRHLFLTSKKIVYLYSWIIHCFLFVFFAKHGILQLNLVESYT